MGNCAVVHSTPISALIVVDGNLVDHNSYSTNAANLTTRDTVKTTSIYYEDFLFYSDFVVLKVHAECKLYAIIRVA